MLRNPVFSGAVLIAATLVAVAGGQFTPPAQSRIAVCDMTALFGNLRMINDLERMFAERQKQLETDATARREPILKLQKELESGAFAPGSADYEQRQADLIRQQVEMESWLRNEDRKLRQAHKRWFLDVYDRAVRACASIAESAGVQVVLADPPIEIDVPDVKALISQIRQKKVIYAHPSLDLTELARQQLDAAYDQQGGAASLKVAN